MKNINKITAVALIASFIGVQATFAQSANYNYNYSGSNTFGTPVPRLDEVPSLGSAPVYSPAPLKGQVTVVPSGTQFQVQTTNILSSTSTQLGEVLNAKIVSPIYVNGVEAVPAGSEAVGQVTYIQKAGRVGKNAVIDVKFTNIVLPNGQRVPVMGKIETIDKTGQLKGGEVKDQLLKSLGVAAASTAGGTLAGLGVGSLMGSAGGGAVFGVTAGSLIGLGWLFGRKGKEVVIPRDMNMVITLEQPLTLSN